MVGVGNLGMPVARRLSAAGYPLVVFARRAEAIEEARGLGASINSIAGLGSYSSPILPVGDVGDGQKVKLLNNALFGAQVAMVVRIEQCAQELGMDPALVLAAIRECSGDSYALKVAVGAGSARSLVELARRYIEKDVAVCAEIAEELGADLGSVLTVAREL